MAVHLHLPLHDVQVNTVRTGTLSLRDCCMDGGGVLKSDLLDFEREG